MCSPARPQNYNFHAKILLVPDDSYDRQLFFLFTFCLFRQLYIATGLCTGHDGLLPHNLKPASILLITADVAEIPESPGKVVIPGRYEDARKQQYEVHAGLHAKEWEASCEDSIIIGSEIRYGPLYIV